MANMKPIAIELAKKQREIGVAEFFARNRHLLGYDNKRKALLTVVKECVDNSLDACEEANLLPEISIEVIQLSEDHFRIIVEDNGPGIVKKQIPKIFARLLYGSKFHILQQARGQQGIGVSAAVLYSQLTTGKPVKITSKIAPEKPALYYELQIDTKKNEPQILKEEITSWNKNHGTKIELDIEASYLKGDQSVDTYLKETAIVNPHLTLLYTNPKAEQIIFPRASEKLPALPQPIKPHPYGVELGILIEMLKLTKARTLQSFLITEFVRVGPNTAKEICQNAALLPDSKPRQLSRDQAEKLIEGIQKTKIIAPPSNCINPISAEELEKGLRKEINAEFYCAATRPPAVYRGIPFVVEAALAYGGQQSEDYTRLLRFANRVPLLYQQSAGAIFRSAVQTNWHLYGLSQSNRSLPQAPLTLAVHLASVWVPFTSESKEALAHYPEIIKEIKLALQECGRKLHHYLSKKRRIQAESQKRSYIETYIPHISQALKELINISNPQKVEKLLLKILEKHRGELEKIKMENPDYDEELAQIGKEEPKKEPPEDKTKTEKQTKLTKNG